MKNCVVDSSRRGHSDTKHHLLLRLQDFLLRMPCPLLQVLPAGKDGERCLLLWGVEDAVKRRYQQYVELLQKCSTDNLDFIKEKATKIISRLLSAKPEGEQVLLSALVNKLGDPSRKLASDAGYLLGQLLLEHPAMKPVVVREVCIVCIVCIVVIVCIVCMVVCTVSMACVKCVEYQMPRSRGRH